jgi:hypothetical protein
MDTSVFMDKARVPSEKDLKLALGATFETWRQIAEFVFANVPAVTGEWNFSGAKYGWSYRIKDKKRAVVYLLPRREFFKVAMVFGPAATEKVLKSEISEAIRKELEAAKPYAEGRGIRIDVKDDSVSEDIFEMIRVKSFS